MKNDKWYRIGNTENKRGEYLVEWGTESEGVSNGVLVRCGGINPLQNLLKESGYTIIE